MDSRFPHLPPGREPGAQSRRGRTGRGAGAVVAVLLAVCFAGLAVYGASDPGEAPAWIFLAVFGTMAAGALAVAAYIVRRGRGRPARHFSVSARPAEVARGGEVEAELRLSGEPEGRLQVGLVCTERHDYERVWSDQNGTHRSRETREQVIYEAWQDVTDRSPLQRLRFAVPGDRPFSYEGSCLSFAWAVRAREQRDRRRDPRADDPIWVAP